MLYTDDQIAQVAVNAGFPTSDANNLAICVSIAQAESSGRTDATNANGNGSTDRGLWQINSVHDSKLPGQDRFDPLVNAKLMLQISNNGTNWQPWTTYTTGAYQKYLAEAISTVASKGYKPNASALTGGSNAEQIGVSSAVDTSGIEKFFSGLGDQDTWIRIGQVSAGGIAVLLALVLYFRDGIMSTATQVAGKLV